MNDVAALLAQLPDDAEIGITIQIRIGDLRKSVVATQPRRVLTTSDAAEIFGWSSSGWAKWAAAGVIEDAWQDANNGPWRLPYESCEAHVAALRAAGTRAGGEPRGGWKSKAKGASAARAGAEGVQVRSLTLLEGGSPSVGRQAGHDAGPRASEVAGPGRAHSEPGHG